MKIKLMSNAYEYTFETESEDVPHYSVAVNLESLASRACKYYSKNNIFRVVRTNKIRNFSNEHEHFFWATTRTSVGKDIGIFRIHMYRVNNENRFRF